MDFGTQVREWRIVADLSQRDLARRVGMDFTQLSRIETGLLAPPADDKIRALALALGRSTDEMHVLLNLAEQARVPTDVIKSAIIRNPEVGALLRRLKNQRLSEEDAKALQRIAQRGQDSGGTEKQEGDLDASM